MIGENFGSFLDFTKTYKDLGFKYLSFVFRRGKHIRFPKDFPSDLREACLGKNSYYLENADDLKKGNEARRQAKSLVRAVLTNDELINEYFKGHYFTYEDYLSLRETMGLAGGVNIDAGGQAQDHSAYEFRSNDQDHSLTTDLSMLAADLAIGLICSGQEKKSEEQDLAPNKRRGPKL